MASTLRPPLAPSPPRVAASHGTLTPRTLLVRSRCAGGPQDRALYRCDCGAAFRAPVSASVACPVCGGEQSW